MSKDFVISFYMEGNEDAGFYAWLSQSSPKEEFGRGATIYEALANLCRLLDGDDACLNNIRKEIVIDAVLRAAGYDPDEIGAQMKAAAEAALARVAPTGRKD